NLALNSGVQFFPWLRSHLTVVARNGNWSLSPGQLIQEGYLEAGGFTRLAGDRLNMGLRYGKVQNTSMPDFGPLPILDQMPRWSGNTKDLVPGYQQVVPFLDWQSRYAIGFHTSASYDMFNGGSGLSPINGYLRLRAENSHGYLMEFRGGWLTSRSL